jgi:hypothetical protein
MAQRQQIKEEETMQTGRDGQDSLLAQRDSHTR